MESKKKIELDNSVIEWCKKYSILFHTLYEDEELREFFNKYNVYQTPQGHQGL